MEQLFPEMARIASEYETQFKQAQKSWDSNCHGVDRVLERLARRHNGELERWREDTPSRALLWTEGGVGYSVSMMLGEEGKHPSLTVYSAVWQDDEESLRRASIQLPEELVDTPVRVRGFRKRVTGLVEALHQQSDLLRQRPFPTSVSITPLSPSQ